MTRRMIRLTEVRWCHIIGAFVVGDRLDTVVTCAKNVHEDDSNEMKRTSPMRECCHRHSTCNKNAFK